DVQFNRFNKYFIELFKYIKQCDIKVKKELGQQINELKKNSLLALAHVPWTFAAATSFSMSTGTCSLLWDMSLDLCRSHAFQHEYRDMFLILGRVLGLVSPPRLSA
ncbi:MAG: hypothetical protein Q8761_02890, partial [Sweet potato little leaf phytoplasma]|nr:hypothetical protein [Sweet potato little leaf phytoplasma]